MLRKTTCIVLLALMASAASANLVKNGDFDNWWANWGRWSNPGWANWIEDQSGDKVMKMGQWGGSIWQNTQVVIQPNTIYTMTVTARNDYQCEGAELIMEAPSRSWDDIAGPTVRLFPAADQGVHPGPWRELTLSWDSSTDPSFVGHTMGVGVRLFDDGSWGSSSWIQVTRVELTALSTLANTPNPVDGATHVEPDALLSWNPGNFTQPVDGHRVYIDKDASKVAARTGCWVNGETTSDPNYLPATPLDWDDVYYWAIDEVNGVSVWQGPTWSFTVRGKPVPPQLDLWITDVEETKAQLNMICLDDGNEPPVAFFRIRGDFENQWHWINAGLPSDGDLVVEKLTNLIPGTTYDVGANLAHQGGEGDIVTSFTTLGEKPPLYIYQQPQDQLAYPGRNASCSVGVVSTSDKINYTWFKKSASGAATLVGSNSPVLNIPAVTDATTGAYYCIITAEGVPAVEITRDAQIAIRRMVAHWKLDGDLVDATGNGWDGAMASASVQPAFGAGVFCNGPAGQSLDVTESVKNFMVVPGSGEAFNFYANAFTVSAWVRTRSPHWECIASKQLRASGPWKGWVLDTHPDGRVQFDIRGAKGVYSSKKVSDGSWHMVTATYDGSVVRIYIDGAFDGSAINKRPVATHDLPVIIGAEREDGFVTMDGQIDDVRILNYAASPAEVGHMREALMNPSLLQP